MDNEDKKVWRLDKIQLEFSSYGKDKGKYIGTIRFENEEFEYFQFKIRPDMAQAYIDLIAKEVVACASELSGKLIESLRIKE